MEIPTQVKRRIVDIEKYLDRLLKNYTHYNKVERIDLFIHHACHNLSAWFVTKHINNKDIDGAVVMVHKYRKFFVHMFSKKITLYWGNMLFTPET